MLQSRRAIEKKERRGIGRNYYCFDDRDDPIAKKAEDKAVMLMLMEQSTKMYERQMSMNKTNRPSKHSTSSGSRYRSGSCSCPCSCKCSGSCCRPTNVSHNQSQKHQASKQHDNQYHRSTSQSHKSKPKASAAASSFQQAISLTML